MSSKSFFVLFAATTLFLTGCSKGPEGKGIGQKKGDMAVPVTTASVMQKDVPVEIQVIGNVEAYSTITVRGQIGGELIKVHFKEGDFVKRGDLLFNIDPRPLQAQLSQAEANHAKAKALLGQAQANLVKDKAQAQYLKSQSLRVANLVKQGIMSKDQGESTQAAADATVGTLDADLATIESAKAEINATRSAADNLKVQLGYTEIRSPIDGRTGNLIVKLGNLVGANTMDLVTINQVQPIYVTFSIPESQLGNVKRYMAQGKLLVTATPQDNPDGKESGVLTFIDNAVDAATGTIKMKGTFENSHRTLWPGQFVRVVLRLTTQQGALVVPNQAVQSGQEGPFVFVVKQDKTVDSRPVTTGARVDQELVIEKGLAVGETVVTEGQLRLAPNSRVSIRDGKGAGRGEGRGKRAE